jgi:hypothetical protein
MACFGKQFFTVGLLMPVSSSFFCMLLCCGFEFFFDFFGRKPHPFNAMLLYQVGEFPKGKLSDFSRLGKSYFALL